MIPKHVSFLIDTFSGAKHHKNTVNVNDVQTLQYLHTSVVKRMEKIQDAISTLTSTAPNIQVSFIFPLLMLYFLVCLLVFSFLVVCVLRRLLSWFQKLANVVVLNFYKNKTCTKQSLV